MKAAWHLQVRDHEIEPVGFEDLDRVEIARRDVDLALLEQGRERAGIGGDRREIGLQLSSALLIHVARDMAQARVRCDHE